MLGSVLRRIQQRPLDVLTWWEEGGGFHGSLIKGVVSVSFNNLCAARRVSRSHLHQRGEGPPVTAFGQKLASPKCTKDIFSNVQDKVKMGVSLIVAKTVEFEWEESLNQ